MKLQLELPSDDDEIDITPMLDCIFLLVLFFMVTSSFIDEGKESRPYSLTLPKTTEAGVVDPEGETLQLTLSGDYFIREGSKEQRVANAQELLEKLKQAKAAGSKDPIVLRSAARIEDFREVKPEEARALKVTLPRADQAVSVARKDADVVTLTVDGLVFIDHGWGQQKLENLEALRLLLEKRTKDKLRPVILRCDARCQYQQFIQAKNALKLAGVETIFEEVEVRP